MQWGLSPNRRAAFIAGLLLIPCLSSSLAAQAARPDDPLPGVVHDPSVANQRIGRGLSAFLNLDNVTDSQDPNTGILLPNGAPAPLYRPDAGRTARIGVQWSFSAQ